MSIKENYAVNHRLVTDLPLVISGWLKVGVGVNMANGIYREYFTGSIYGSTTGGKTAQFELP